MKTQIKYDYIIYFDDGNQLPWDGVTPLDFNSKITYIEEVLTETEYEKGAKIDE